MIAARHDVEPERGNDTRIARVIGEGFAAMAIAVMIGMTSALLVRPLLRRLPESIPGDGKPSYRELGSARFLFVCGALAGIAAAISWSSPNFLTRTI